MAEIILLVISLCIDSIAVSYTLASSQQIRVGWGSSAVISGIGAGILLLSLSLASGISGIIPKGICVMISGIFLIALGFMTSFTSVLKGYLKGVRGLKRLKFRLAGIDWVISLYLDESLADTDLSKSISPREAVALAITLSLDSLVSGFSAGLSMGGVKIITLTVGALFILGVLGVYIGNRLGFWSKGKTLKKRLELDWISGLTLITLGIIKLIKY